METDRQTKVADIVVYDDDKCTGHTAYILRQGYITYSGRVPIGDDDALTDSFLQYGSIIIPDNSTNTELHHITSPSFSP